MDGKHLVGLLPQYQEWVDALFRTHASQMKPTASLRFQKLSKYMSDATLKCSRFVVVDELPSVFPHLGLPTPPGMNFQFGGITFRDVYFITPGNENSESLHFHEIVHTAQWRILGDKLFAYIYAVEAFTKDYRRNALEKMAYDLQEAFERGDTVFPLEAMVAYHFGHLLPDYLTKALFDQGR